MFGLYTKSYLKLARIEAAAARAGATATVEAINREFARREINRKKVA